MKIQKDICDIFKSGLDQFLPFMNSEIRNGISLIDMVRAMRRSEDKEIPLYAVPVKAALNESLLLLREKIQEKGICIDLDAVELSVLAERTALINSVFNNILTNAIKFSEPGSHISIKANATEEMACVSFADHGIGMSATTMENMFNMGISQSRMGTAGEEGTGFGMPLMKRFVTKFGGRVEVSSRDIESNPNNHGTKFQIWLKRA